MDDQIYLSQYPELKNLVSNIINDIHKYTRKQLTHIKNMQRIAISLSAEKNENKIYDMILEEALSYTNSDGATIYSVSDDGKFLDFKVVYNRTLNIRKGGTRDKIEWPSLPLYTEGKKRMGHMATYVYHTGQSQFVDDVYEQSFFDTKGTKLIDEQNNYRTKSMMTIPLKDHENEVLGVIQLLNAMDERGHIIPFSEHHMTMLNSLASQTAITFSNRKLIADLEHLLFKFIEAIAGAIDRKSEYTGGHIRRVAQLTSALAEKINLSDSGFFKDRNFTEDELKEINISGWLHDIGKIITPVHVMDKPRKLVTIFDRIEFIKAKFEVVRQIIKKDMIIAKYENKPEVIIEKEKLLDKLADDLQFLVKGNFGAEFVSEKDMERIEGIAHFTYESDGEIFSLINDNEKENLEIQRGTLSKDEFNKIQEHAQTTLDMLQQLDFPKKYKNVPDYAGSHHEKLNGKGYPRHLKGDEIALQARIVCIADLYEALTASDRPYKKGNMISKSLQIMGFIARDGEIDKDLLDLFIDTKLYLEFAEKCLPKEQIDEVDLDKIKSIYHEKNK